MKIISLFCLLVNLTSSLKKKRKEKEGVWMRCFSLAYSQFWTHAVIIPRLFLWESDAALGKHKEVREHPWTLSMRGHWYSNNMQAPFDCAEQRAFQIQHLHVTLCPFFFRSLKNCSHNIDVVCAREKDAISSFSGRRLVCKWEQLIWTIRINIQGPFVIKPPWKPPDKVKLNKRCLGD